MYVDKSIVLLMSDLLFCVLDGIKCLVYRGRVYLVSSVFSCIFNEQ